MLDIIRIAPRLQNLGLLNAGQREGSSPLPHGAREFLILSTQATRTARRFSNAGGMSGPGDQNVSQAFQEPSRWFRLPGEQELAVA